MPTHPLGINPGQVGFTSVLQHTVRDWIVSLEINNMAHKVLSRKCWLEDWWTAQDWREEEEVRRRF